jgi:hypothetical protein
MLDVISGSLRLYPAQRQMWAEGAILCGITEWSDSRFDSISRATSAFDCPGDPTKTTRGRAVFGETPQRGRSGALNGR